MCEGQFLLEVESRIESQDLDKDFVKDLIGERFKRHGMWCLACGGDESLCWL
jgi:hypothetical protein